jgi:hypothetical protein
MHILPQNDDQWLGFMVLPFKVYTIAAPLLFLISSNFPQPRHTGPTDVEAFLIIGLFPCSAILLVAALALAFFGPKGSALPCLGFGVAAFAIGFLFLPCLATA